MQGREGRGFSPNARSALRRHRPHERPEARPRNERRTSKRMSKAESRARTSGGVAECVSSTQSTSASECPETSVAARRRRRRRSGVYRSMGCSSSRRLDFGAVCSPEEAKPTRESDGGRKGAESQRACQGIRNIARSGRTKRVRRRAVSFKRSVFFCERSERKMWTKIFVIPVDVVPKAGLRIFIVRSRRGRLDRATK